MSRLPSDQKAALAELMRTQGALPAAWHEDAAWDLPEPEVAPFPEDFDRVNIDMREVLESWRAVS